MKSTLLHVHVLVLLLAGTIPLGLAQEFQAPKVVEAGSAFSISTSGNGEAVLYIVSPSGVFRRTVQLGQTIAFEDNEITSAGHYLALLAGKSFTRVAEFDVAEQQPAVLSFLAKPSRLPVSQSGGISGVVYVFDRFHNLVLNSQTITFRLSGAGTGSQSETTQTENGAAWIRVNSPPKAGTVQFEAAVGEIHEKRVIQLVPGEPCSLRMTAQRSGPQLTLVTQPVRDCNGNAVPDGTAITFTETRDGRAIASVDVPLKRDIAQTKLPAYSGAVLSIASGVAMGNEIPVEGVR